MNDSILLLHSELIITHVLDREKEKAMDEEEDLGANHQSIQNLLLKENKHYRELRRIRNSLAFRLGTTIVEAIKFPPKLVILPLSLLLVGINWGLERIGKKEYAPAEGEGINGPTKRCVVMFPTNGVGFGHFTRLMAVAKRLRKLDSELEIVFFTTMSTLHLAKSEGFISYRIPGRKEFKGLSASSWNAITEEALSLVFATHRPSVFVFDGAYPYRGMLNAIQERHNLEKIWLRRGTFKQGATSIPEDSLEHFDYIIRPQDSTRNDVSKEVAKGLDVSHCDPIVLLDKEDLLTREQARSRLGIPDHMTVAYIQLGAGKINNIQSTISRCIKILNEKLNVHTIIGESMLGERVYVEGKRIQILRDYPNSQLFKGFDFSIIAGGYNSYHEAIHLSMPSICIPNTNTGMDDQLARANVAGDMGAMIVLEDPVQAELENAIDRILDPVQRDKMKIECDKLSSENGAIQSADFILSMIKS
jgi:hypothetical protein